MKVDDERQWNKEDERVSGRYPMSLNATKIKRIRSNACLFHLVAFLWLSCSWDFSLLTVYHLSSRI